MFLLYNNVNELYVCIIPSLSSLLPTALLGSDSNELSSPCCPAASR